MGWDVGAWNCDRNRKSQDALLVLEVSGSVPKLIGEPYRHNLSRILTIHNGPSIIREMLRCCDVEGSGSLDVTIAIDTPLGWPQAMLALVTQGGLIDPPKEDRSNRYTRRETEIDLINKGYHPLSTVRDRIGSQSTKGIHFLHAAGLRLSSCGLWMSKQDDISVTAIETYPAPAIEHPYVSTHNSKILRQLHLSAGSVSDTRDAVTCALVAHLFSDHPGSCEGPHNAPEQEGWIFLPRSSWSHNTQA